MLELSRWRIGVRLFAGFGIITFMLILIAAFGVNQIMKVDESKEIILHDRYAKVALAQSIENEVNRQARALRTALIASDKSVIESELGKVENSAPIIASTIEKLQNIIHTDKGKAALKTLVEARQAFKSDEQKLVGMIRSGQVEEGRSYLIKDMLPAQTAYLAAIEAFRESQVEGMEQFGKEADEIAHTALVMNIALAIGATLLSIFISVALTRSITTQSTELKPLQYISR
jgi:methyl-accepting chemotaxis protein